MRIPAGSTGKILLSMAISLLMVFGMAFKNCENGEITPRPDNGGLLTENETGNIVGKWWYSAIISPDGAVRKLNNRESNFIVNDDGTYENNFGHYPNWSQTQGNYSVKGSRLTLIPKDGEKRVYDVAFDEDGGGTLTLKAPDGSGYTLEKE